MRASANEAVQSCSKQLICKERQLCLHSERLVVELVTEVRVGVVASVLVGVARGVFELGRVHDLRPCQVELSRVHFHLQRHS